MYYFKQENEGEIVSVESKSINVASPGFIDATEEEYLNYLASLPPVEPPVDYKELYAVLKNDTVRIDFIATFLGLK